jgi:alkylation response protein AidB-like acyl-CoA dehydrogenase
MDLILDDEQELLRDTVRRFLADRFDATTMGQGPVSRADWGALGELGLLAFLLPEAAGGTGGRPQDAAIVAEELGRALAVTPLGETVAGAADLVARHGGAALAERWVAPVLAGETLLALAVGELDGDARLSGRAEFVAWAPEAAAVVVLGAERAWLLETDAVGIAIEPVRLIDGTPAGQVMFDGCEGTAFALPPGAAETTLASVRLCQAAELVGAMATLYEQTVAYARERKQFGVAIGTFQVVQHKLARMFVVLEQSRSLLLKAAVRDRDDAAFARDVIAAKAYVAEAAQRVAEEAVQLHGGMGVTDELPVGRGLRRVMLLGRAFGGADELRQALAA